MSLDSKANYVNPFTDYHPIVALAYLVGAIILTMACLQPVYAGISFAGAFVCLCVTRTFRKALRALLWALPLFLIVAIVNPLLNSQGSTELFRIGARAVYLEAAIFGACAGAMLAAVLLWFCAWSDCMDSENSMALFGNLLPTVSLMVSQVLRLVPQFVSRGASIRDIQTATSAAAPHTRSQKMAGYVRVVIVLAGWGLEDGLIRGDAMRARGYGCGVRRTLYKRFRFGLGDGLAIAIIATLVLSSAICAFLACSGFEFYPRTGPFPSAFSYASYVALLLFPLALCVKERMSWM